MRRSNCLLHALRHWRWSRLGHWLAMRRSLWGPFPHFATFYEAGDMLLKSEFVPGAPSARALPPPLFDGRVVQTVYRRVDAGAAQP